MPNEPIKQVNKLMVGQLDFSFLPAVPVIPGTSVLNGPVWIGAGVPLPVANCMIGPGLNPITLDVKGISNITGVTNVYGNINRFALTTATGATIKNGISAKNAAAVTTGLSTKAAVQITHGPKTCSATVTTPVVKAGVISGNVTTTTGINPTVAAALATKKSFDIPHPTKDGWRLRHVCIEGPTADVYVRGKLNNSNVIELPEYWRKLVDPETITVNLTPVGTHQELYIDKIEWGTRIIIKNNSGASVNCYYTVYGERVDTDKNISEYEGKTPGDYPGDNEQSSVVGWNYDRRN